MEPRFRNPAVGQTPADAIRKLFGLLVGVGALAVGWIIWPLMFGPESVGWPFQAAVSKPGSAALANAGLRMYGAWKLLKVGTFLGFGAYRVLARFIVTRSAVVFSLILALGFAPMWVGTEAAMAVAALIALGLLLAARTVWRIGLYAAARQAEYLKDAPHDPVNVVSRVHAVNLYINVSSNEPALRGRFVYYYFTVPAVILAALVSPLFIAVALLFFALQLLSAIRGSMMPFVLFLSGDFVTSSPVMLRIKAVLGYDKMAHLLVDESGNPPTQRSLADGNLRLWDSADRLGDEYAWTELVRMFMEHAPAIVVDLRTPSPGLMKELDLIEKGGFDEKCIFIHEDGAPRDALDSLDEPLRAAAVAPEEVPRAVQELRQSRYPMERPGYDTWWRLLGN